MPPAAEDLTAKAYRSLRRMIVDGRVHTRQRLSHRALSKDLGIGRSPVRDALLHLEAEGLIEHRPNSGIYLRELTPRELECIYELRLVNEPYAAEKAADRAEAAHLASLRRLCDEMAATAKKPNLAEWFAKVEHRRRFCRLDMEFHATVMEASGNTIAAKIFANAQLLAFTFAWDLGHGRPEWFAEIMGRTATGHRKIYEAIRRRDPRAARAAMEAHVSWARQEIPEQLAAIAEARD
jgi:GntR family transcriptional regulator, rspAB operon transcriptional repressor